MNQFKWINKWKLQQYIYIYIYIYIYTVYIYIRVYICLWVYVFFKSAVCVNLFVPLDKFKSLKSRTNVSWLQLSLWSWRRLHCLLTGQVDKTHALGFKYNNWIYNEQFYVYWTLFHIISKTEKKKKKKWFYYFWAHFIFLSVNYNNIVYSTNNNWLWVSKSDFIK